MKQKLTIAFAIVLALGVGLFAWTQMGGEPTKAKTAKKGLGKAPPPPRTKAADKKANQGIPPQQVFAYDDDPEGDMQLEGLVLGADEQPVAGVLVTINSNPPRSMKTGEDGTFTFEKLVGRSYAIGARDAERRAGPISHLLTETSEPVVLKLRQGAVLVAEVRDEADRPVSGATVELRALSGQSLSTDADGIATFRGVNPGWHWMVASAGGLAPARAPAQVPEGEGVIVRTRITMQRGVPVSGVVVDADGKPVADARVAGFPATSLFDGIDMRKDGATTDKRGKFTLPAVAAGTYRFVAAKEGHPAASSEPTSVRGDSAVGGVEIRFEAAAVLTGRVVDQNGQAVPWAQVRVRARGAGSGFSAPPRQATADEGGAFELKGLAKKKTVAFAQSDTASSELVEVDLHSQDKAEVELQLSVTGSIAGVVADTSGDPISEAQVVAFPDFWSGERSEDFMLRGPSSVRTDPGGRFTVTGIPPGKYRIRASRSSSDQSIWQTAGQLAESGDKDVRIVLAEEGGISGQLRDEAGGHPELFTVTPRFPPGTPVVSEEGKFEIRNLPPGKYDVTFRGRGFTDKTLRDVEVPEGKIKNLGTVDVIRGRAITGRVLDGSGSTVEGATVVAGLQVIGDGNTVVSAFGDGADQAQKVKRATTNSSGEFTLTGVGPRELVIVAQHKKGRSLGIAVPAQATDSQVELKLRRYAKVSGVVKIGGEATAGLQVIATSKEGSGNQMNVVATGQDGSYVFDRLPGGDYQLKAMSAGFGTAVTGSAEFSVREGGRAKVNIIIEIGELDVAVNIKGKQGATIDAAQAFLFPGDVVAENGQQIHDKFVQAAGGVQMAFAAGGKRVSFAKVRPGQHSVCVVPINGNLQDATFQKRLNEHRMELLVHCQSYQVAESPKSQELEIVVPPMAPFPE